MWRFQELFSQASTATYFGKKYCTSFTFGKEDAGNPYVREMKALEDPFHPFSLHTMLQRYVDANQMLCQVFHAVRDFETL